MSFSLRPHLLGMSPYSPGKPIDEVKRELGLERVIKLASNENPLGPSPKAVDAVKAAAENLHLYPDAAAYSLKQAISETYDLDPGLLMIGNGSDELIHYLCQCFLDGAETQMMMGNPSFVRYESGGQLADSQVIKVPLNSEWRHDVEAMAAALTPQTRLVFIANPNNPTGTMVSKAEVDWLLERLPSGCVLVLDEAYVEFAEGVEDFPVSLDYIRKGAPVVGLRTFSKAYGLAGIRVGWGAAPRAIIDAVDRIREPFNVNILAQSAAIAALGDPGHVASTVALNRQGLERIESVCRELGFSVVPSLANFACIDLGKPARPLFDALLKEGIIARCGDVLGMPNHLRVSIGTEEEMGIFLEAFKRLA